MNKGIIIEKHINYSIVLTRDGSFEKAVILEPQADIGEEALYQPYERPKLLKKILDRYQWLLKTGIVSTLITLFIFCSFYLTGTSKTYAYITIDINPSLDIQVDRFMKVQHITPKNEDAEELLASFPVDKKTDLYAIIDEIINLCEDNSLMEGKRNMLVGVSYADEKQQAIERNIINNTLIQDKNWNIISFNIPPEIRQRALENNTSMNKEFALLIRDQKNITMNMNQLKVESIHSFYEDPDEQ